MTPGATAALDRRPTFALPAAAGLTAAAGIVSAATVSVGFAHYMREISALPSVGVVLVMIGGLGIVAAWGVRESIVAAGLLTILEVAGLVAVLLYGGHHLSTAEIDIRAAIPQNIESVHLLAIGSSAVLCFYAFLGFEDIVNVAEEVLDVRRAMRRVRDARDARGGGGGGARDDFASRWTRRAREVAWTSGSVGRSFIPRRDSMPIAMSRGIVLAIVLASVVGDVLASIGPPRVSDGARALKARRRETTFASSSSSSSSSRSSRSRERWFDGQRLNHFDAGDLRMWSQRYFVNDHRDRESADEAPAVVFLCVGGEGPALTARVVEDGGEHCAVATSLA